MTVRRVLAGLAALIVVLSLLFATTLYFRVLRTPPHEDVALGPGSIALSSPEGAALLERARQADHAVLLASLQSQEKRTWSGVAAAVTVIDATRDPDITQAELFTPAARAVRGWWTITLNGMPIDALAGILEAHGLHAEVTYAEGHTLSDFLAEAERNLSTPGDFLIVNYDRQTVGEVGHGNLSPVSALSDDGRYALVLDTAGYKYPPHWVPTDALFDAMGTPDSESGHSRGWLVVRP